ncbi:AsnC family transcriptional regulator [Rhodobacterales bacterium 52_120_T64]|nr:AsnC family transcriptional regulator [Rhodobacterales bacterium 52_120_T64]
MDEKDRQILRELQKDGRTSNAELAERVNLSPSPCLRRLRILEKSGVIEGYTAIVNQKAYGLPVTVFIQIRLDHHSTEAAQEFERRIHNINEIIDCHLMTGDTDYLLRVVVESLESYEVFIRERIHPIPAIASINTSFAYGVVKQSRVLP